MCFDMQKKTVYHIIARDTVLTTKYRNISQYYHMKYILITKAYYMNNSQSENFTRTTTMEICRKNELYITMNKCQYFKITPY